MNELSVFAPAQPLRDGPRSALRVKQGTLGDRGASIQIRSKPETVWRGSAHAAHQSRL